MSSAVVMIVIDSTILFLFLELYVPDSPWIGLQVSAVVRGATRCDAPNTTSSPPPSKSSQGVTIQPQEVARGYAHEGEIEQERNAKLIFNPFNQYSNTVDTGSRSTSSQSQVYISSYLHSTVQYGITV